MIPLSRNEVKEALRMPGFPWDVSGISTDTRTMRPGDLFVALRGKNTDGHEYVKEALQRGAVAVLLEEAVAGAYTMGDGERPERPGKKGPDWASRIVAVSDTHHALGQLARAVRRKSGAQVIALTGSVGKTGTKDLIAAMAGRQKVVLATRANENNEIGVPLTLLRIEPATEVAVVEMGMRGMGQIAELAAWAEPDVGVVTNVAPVHLELVGTIQAVAQAKAELLLGLAPGGTGVIPADCALLAEWAGMSGRRIIHFSAGQETCSPGEVDVRGRIIEAGDDRWLVDVEWPGGRTSVEAPFRGLHRLRNTVCAAAACYAAGLSVEACLPGLREVAFTAGRGDEYRVGEVTVIDDTYNANPVAVAEALTDLVYRVSCGGGRTVAVLADMLELGADAVDYHYRVGVLAALLGVDVMYGVGVLAKHMVEGFREQSAALSRNTLVIDEAKLEELLGRPLAGRPADNPMDRSRVSAARGLWFETAAECLSMLSNQILPGDWVLVKGSRSMNMERVVQHLLDRRETAT